VKTEKATMTHAKNVHAALAAIPYILKGATLTLLLAIGIPLTALAQTPPTQPIDLKQSLHVAPAEQASTAKEEKPFSLGDTLENLGRVYKNEENETLQELWLLGRYHGQYHWTEANTGEDDGYETRRFRLGAQAKMFKKLTMHGQMVSGSNIDPFYNGFTELWAQWAFSP
jgi:hypothetical protein